MTFSDEFDGTSLDKSKWATTYAGEGRTNNDELEWYVDDANTVSNGTLKFLGFNPHCHVLVTDGCFYGKGMFRVAPPLDQKKLEAIFRHRVFKMLLDKGRIRLFRKELFLALN